MEDIVLTFNWQNMFTIWLMVIILAVVITVGAQLVRRTGLVNNAEQLFAYIDKRMGGCHICFCYIASLDAYFSS